MVEDIFSIRLGNNDIDLINWRKNHKEFNHNNFYKQQLRNHINNEKKVDPVFLLASIFGMVIGMVLILVGWGAISITIWIRLFILLLGTITFGATLIVFAKGKGVYHGI